MGTAPSRETCPNCGDDAKRVFSTPFFSSPSRLSSAMERAEASRHEPLVAHRERETSHRDTRNRVNPAMEKLVGKEAARDLKVAAHPAKPSP